MQIVIDIPEEDYKIIKTQVTEGITNSLKMCIANGISLPKGHGRLIDADELLSKHSDDITNWKEPYGVSNRNIIKAPTILEAVNEFTSHYETKARYCMSEETKYDALNDTFDDADDNGFIRAFEFWVDSSEENTCKIPKDLCRQIIRILQSETKA